MTPDLELLFKKIEDAIDATGVLKRLENCLGQPSFVISRDGCRVEIKVRVADRRRLPTEIWASGEDPESAVEALLQSLPSWVKVNS